MKQVTVKWTCDKCKREFDEDDLMGSQTGQPWHNRGMGQFTRRVETRDIGGSHLGQEDYELCEKCAEIIEMVILNLEVKS